MNTFFDLLEIEEPTLEVFGDGADRVLIVGGSPTMSEEGIFSSSGYGAVRRVEHHLDRYFFDDCWLCYAYPEAKGKEPTTAQINSGGQKLRATIEKLKPKAVVLMGADVVQGFFAGRRGGRIASVQSSAFFGEQIPDREFGCWILPTHSPKHLTDEQKTADLYNAFLHTFQTAFRGTSIPPLVDVRPEQIIDSRGACVALREARGKGVVAFDFETTGIKPHREGHRIVSVGLAWEGYCCAFPFFDDPDFRREWYKLMHSPKVKRVAHFGGFEAGWDLWRGSGELPRIDWDTCIVQHILHNQKPTGLKFLTYAKLGVLGYDVGVDQYIRGRLDASDSSDNAFNRVAEAPQAELLQYNALDALYTLEIWKTQKLDAHLQRGYEFFTRGQNVISALQQTGICVDVEELERRKTELDGKIEQAHKKILSTEEGKKAPPGINFLSALQLSRFLYHDLGYKRPSGSATDEAALSSLNSPFADAVIEFKKLKKLRSTYLGSLEREVTNGKLYPFFHLHRVVTYRSSSSSPNFQNFPKRDQAAQDLIRTIIVPRKGNRLIEYDYKSIEVSISACYHQDPAMIKYVTDPTTDMHRDMAIQLFKRSKTTFTKRERHCAKNGFVFPAFYGSRGENMAANLWDMIPIETRLHLKETGIDSLRKFEAHVLEVEKDFWENRFRVYNDWKWDIWHSYKEKGHVELKTGFRCVAPMRFTEATNAQIQGSAFHCLLYTLTHAFEEIRAISGRSTIIGQIHDSIVADVHPEDEAEVDRIIKFWGTEQIRKDWDWIVVPLRIDKDRSEVDGSWANMENVGAI